MERKFDLYNFEEPIADESKEKKDQYDRFLSIIPKRLATIENVLDPKQRLEVLFEIKRKSNLG